MSVFSQRLIQARKEANLTQAGLAELSGLSALSIRNLESGDTKKPQETTTRALKAALGINFESLVNRDSFSSSRSPIAGKHGNCCPECGGAGEVNDSRLVPKSYGVVRRRRQCIECGTLWTTYEIRKDDLKQDKSIDQAKHMIKEMVAFTLGNYSDKLDEAINELCSPD